VQQIGRSVTRQGRLWHERRPPRCLPDATPERLRGGETPCGTPVSRSSGATTRKAATTTATADPRPDQAEPGQAGSVEPGRASERANRDETRSWSNGDRGERRHRAGAGLGCGYVDTEAVGYLVPGGWLEAELPTLHYGRGAARQSSQCAAAEVHCGGWGTA